MDVLNLLRSAEVAGLAITVEDDTLRIRGPKKAEPLVRELMANKAGVLRELKGSAAPDLRECDAETASLINWFFHEGQHRLPQHSFRLCSWITVTNPVRFKESLLRQIRLGAHFITNKNGKLREDLQLLKTKLTPGSHTETGESNARSTTIRSP